MDKATLIDSFLNAPDKHISLMGMSGVGKTHLSKKLPRERWFHYSIDYRIGTRYLNEEINDFFKLEAMKSDLLRKLLCNNSISIKSNLTFDNLQPLSIYLGMVGALEKGGSLLEDFLERLEKHRIAEINASYDVLDFMTRAKRIYQYPNFIADLSGSFCELGDDALSKTLGEATLLIYLKASDRMQEKVIERAQTHPKPLYYQAPFLMDVIKQYCEANNLASEREIDPSAFAIWVFPRLIEHRLSLYESIAERFGITLCAEEVYFARDETDFFNLIEKAKQ